MAPQLASRGTSMISRSPEVEVKLLN